MSTPAPGPAARPRWMSALAALCLATAFFLAARDLLIADVRDVEVWLGFEVRGAAARLTAPLHWGIFLVGAWAFWRDRPWIVPAGAAYALYVALSHLIWSGVSPRGHGWAAGLLYAAALSLPGLLLLHAHRHWHGSRPRPRVLRPEPDDDRDASG